MWLNENDKLLILFLSSIKTAPQRTLKLIWNSGTIIIVSYDTDYESETCSLDDDDPDYEEFWACLVKIENIISIAENDNLHIPKVGSFYEITYHNIPDCYEPVFQ